VETGKQATPSAVPVGVCKHRIGDSSCTNAGNVGCTNLLSFFNFDLIPVFYFSFFVFADLE
jgi:hypothetical protein